MQRAKKESAVHRTMGAGAPYNSRAANPGRRFCGDDGMLRLRKAARQRARDQSVRSVSIALRKREPCTFIFGLLRHDHAAYCGPPQSLSTMDSPQTIKMATGSYGSSCVTSQLTPMFQASRPPLRPADSACRSRTIADLPLDLHLPPYLTNELLCSCIGFTRIGSPGRLQGIKQHCMSLRCIALPPCRQDST